VPGAWEGITLDGCCSTSLSLCRGKSSAGRPFLLLKASARQMPLPDDSVSLVIATPPCFGVRRLRRVDYCTNHADEYARLITEFLEEATRIVKPRRHILLTSRKWRAGKSQRARRVLFHVLQKRTSRSQRTLEPIKSEIFLTHFVKVRDFPWWALPLRLYRDLICRYTEPGEIVAHVFSGSGNGGIAALQLARKPILIDLYYHRQTRRRLTERVPSIRPKPVPCSGHSRHLSA
jgi:hypothetical protein